MYLKKSERAQIRLQLKNLEKQQTKFKPIRQQDIIKIRANIDKIQRKECKEATDLKTGLLRR